MCFGSSTSKDVEYDAAPQPAMNYANNVRRNRKYPSTASYNYSAAKKPRYHGAILEYTRLASVNGSPSLSQKLLRLSKLKVGQKLVPLIRNLHSTILESEKYSLDNCSCITSADFNWNRWVLGHWQIRSFDDVGFEILAFQVLDLEWFA
ncbi:hypothetical protein HG530_013261 [Fusarium avenaceum]|nr:hypothetical protein HG530_013261 [Fusarium avenaceum]